MGYTTHQTSVSRSRRTYRRCGERRPDLFGTGVNRWDRSPKWSQFRSTGRQRGWWLDRVQHDRRVRPRRSARCEKRGVQSNHELGVAKLGTDGPARRSRWLSPACWTGPPPIHRCGAPPATNRMTRPPRRSPPREAARGFRIRAWSQRGSALQRTGRSSDPARWLGFFEGGLDDPRHSRHGKTNSLRGEHPIRTLAYRTLVTCLSNRDLYLSYDSYLLE